MKIRTDYVTNSSSSSFIISRHDISEENLLKLLLELANETAWWDDEEEDTYRYTDEDFEYYSDEDCISISNFNLREATEDKPYNSYYEWDKYSDNDGGITYTNHYIIDNDSCCRYEWYTIKEVLAKHNLNLICGYCD